jgi:hypothetical protein
MVLDSDEEEATDDSPPAISNFEEVEEERDAFEPYDKLLRYIDVRSASSLRQIAVPHIPVNVRDSASGAYPPIFLSKIVVVAACEDGSIKVITLPILPPQPFIDGSTYKSVQIVSIAGSNTHKVVPSSIAVTHSAISDTSESQRSQSKTRSRDRPSMDGDGSIIARAEPSAKQWCFLIVSSSATAGGLLLTHQIILSSDGTSMSNSAHNIPPIHRRFLGTSCLRSKVVFNPSAFPADRHSTVLLSTADSSSVKIYQVSPQDPKPSLSRRNSAAITESLGSDVCRSEMVSPSSGRFLITLHTSFMRCSDSVGTHRKRVVDVAWVCSGRAILALLEDGEWGIWDLEGVGPASGSAKLLQGQRNISSIKGGALNRFAFSGMVTSPTQALSKPKKSQASNAMEGTLAPMTPHTRKVRSEGLFRGERAGSGARETGDPPIEGIICVTEHVPTRGSTLPPPEESLVVAHGSNVIYISSLQALWRAETSSEGTLDSVDTVRPFHCLAQGPSGNRMVAISELTQHTHKSQSPISGTRSSKSPDLVVAGDRRLTFTVSPLTESAHTEDRHGGFPLRLGKTIQTTEEEIDQLFLGRGELGLDGMDRILDGMDRQDRTANGSTRPFGKKVAFDLTEDDEDVSMSSPTPKTSGKPRRTPGRQIGRAGRRTPFS